MVVLCLLTICLRSPQTAFSKCLFANDNQLVVKCKQVWTSSENVLKKLWSEKPPGFLAQYATQYATL